MEPWLAAGDMVTTIEDRQREVLGALWRTERARLLVPVRSGPGDQFVPGQSAADSVSLVVPGVPESDKAFRLAPGALEPLRPERVTGGTRVTLEEFGLTSLVLFTGQPLVIHQMRQRAEAIARRAAQRQRELADAKLQALAPRHASAAQSGATAGAWLAAATEELHDADAALATRDYGSAYQHAARATRPLRLLERSGWEPAAKTLFSPVAHPAAVSWNTLPAFGTLASRLTSAQPTVNLIEPARFDDLEAMLRGGWRHFQRASPGVDADAELAAKAARSGRFGLRLAARPADGTDPDLLLENAPCRITSPTVRVEPGQWVTIDGWVNVPAPITGSVDGLLILDSLTGESLAQRIVHTSGWQRFTLYRAAAGAETLTVTFALTGFGEAWIDDVRIQAIPMGRPIGSPSSAGRFPAVPSR
jgi:hypothetical protein